MNVLDLLNDVKKEAVDYVPGGTPLPPIPEGITKCKLDANENQFGPSPKVVEALKGYLDDMYLYPANQITPTRNAIANNLGFEPNNIVMGTGSSSLICAVADLFFNPGDEMVLSTPTYIAYTLLESRYGITPVCVDNKNFASDVHGMLASITPKTKIAVIVNPNNPTGAKVSNEDMRYFMENVPEHVITVVDEAYFEWVDDKEHISMMEYVKAGKNVIVLRTFSKLYGLAGLRLGYAVTTPEIQQHLVKLEFNYGANRLVLQGAQIAIKDEEYIAASINNNTVGRNYISNALKSFGFDIVESSASFVYFNPHRDTQKFILDLNQYGVIIRGFGPTYVRVSIGRPEQNEQFVKAVEAILAKK
ncbi:pyridoxal phosphate-dependent aminotransferase [Tannockella kyphosi]|uniref:pyridoxal phosphate-dependent aminotransferase n=1 Tax=Tannockella kyphosi TaxID=2899121 RepID=UPI002012CD95|nr:histidinol-phosphate transaminase [Tannockella kyphosi]